MAYIKNKYIKPLENNLKQFWDDKYKKPLSWPEFTKIKNALMEEYVNEIATNPNGVKLDNALGELNIEAIDTNILLSETTSELLDGSKRYVIRFKTGRAKSRNKYMRLIAFEPAKKLKDAKNKAVKTHSAIFKRASNDKKRIDFTGKKPI